MGNRTSDEIAPGVFRLGNRTVNWWAIATPEGITLIDAGLRGHRAQLEELLRYLGRSLDDVRAVLLTHSDVDHIGIAEDLRRAGVPIYLHRIEAAAAGGEMRPLPKEALLSLWRPTALVATFEYARDGALRPRFVKHTEPMTPGQALPVPGSPRVLHVPGHTAGSCAFHLEEGSILFTGDALVTVDPFTGRREPTLMPDYDNSDNDLAWGSLDALASTGAELVLPGHGLAWRGGIVEAIGIARDRLTPASSSS